MSRKEDILFKIKANAREGYDMPSLDGIRPTVWPNPLEKFIAASEAVGSRVVSLAPGDDINAQLLSLYPNAKEIASGVDGITIATRNPDTVPDAQLLNGTDVGIVRGELGVAENGCVWVPQTMKERAVCFISEQLVILLSRKAIVSNMHEAYERIQMPDYGYGCFISGPSKTADIAQALVMGAQAARSVTVVLT